jgi:predicted Zn-dependent protease with MMP-like domain
MALSKSVKKSDILAIENIKRIADQLRAERNDAVAHIQTQQAKLESLAALCVEAANRLASDPSAADLVRRLREQTGATS